MLSLVPRYKVSNSVTIVLLIVRLFCILDFHQRLAIITETIREIWTDLWQFAIVFLLTSGCLGFLAWNTFGECVMNTS